MNILFRTLFIALFLTLGTTKVYAGWSFENGGKSFGGPDAACKAAVEGSNAKHHHVEKVEGRDDLYYCYAQHKNGGNIFYSGNAVKDDAPTANQTKKPEPEAQSENTSPTATDAIPWSRARITTIANRPQISVGMHATVTMKNSVVALNGLTGYAAFAQLSENDPRTAALGNGGVVALLPPVQVKNGYQPSSGYLLMPTEPNSSTIEFVTWNTGNPVQDYNASHAEHQFYNFLENNKAWLANVMTIVINVYGLDICEMCDFDLQNLRKMVVDRSPNATVTFQRAE